MLSGILGDSDDHVKRLTRKLVEEHMEEVLEANAALADADVRKRAMRACVQAWYDHLLDGAEVPPVAICPAEIRDLLLPHLTVLLPPVVGNRGRLYDQKARPWRYLPYMIYINRELQDHECPFYSPLNMDRVTAKMHLINKRHYDVVQDDVEEGAIVEVVHGKSTNTKALTTLEIGPVGAKRTLLFNSSITTNGFSASLGYVKDELYGKSKAQVLQMGAAADDYMEPIPPCITDLSPLALIALGNQPLLACDPGKRNLLAVGTGRKIERPR
ncbi:hypothetical protein BC828DRAFT_410168, partial [Blastocladiella britannica]